MRLLWVFSTFALGGPQRRMATLAGSLGSDYEHLIFAMDGRYDAEEVLPAGTRWQRVEEEVRKGGFLSLSNMKTFRAVIAEYRPDLVLTSNWGCIEWLFANRGRGAVPHIHFEDGFWPDERPDRQNFKRVLARRLAFRRRGLAFVAPSRVLKHVFTDTWKVGSERVHLIPNGVDTERFSAGARPERPVVIGTVAALRAEKRIDRLIDCFRAMPESDVRLLIVGDGPERAALEAQAAGLRVTFAGAQSDVAPLLAAIDVFALSSDTEQMPISLVEAMVSGLPVVATDVGDVADMVGQTNRQYVTPVEDERALTGSMVALSTNSESRRALGLENRSKALAEYGLDRMTRRYDALFRQMA